MKSNFTLTSPSVLGAEEEYSALDNDTVNSRSSLWCYFARDLKLTVTFSFMCVVCIFGLVGNGAVIWLLGFCMKRTPFTTYILNLAVADLGVLIAIPVLYIIECNVMDGFYFLISTDAVQTFIQFMYSVSQFLLTSISIDRCVSVLFPLWHRCHRPKNFSTILCALIWILCFLLNGILISLHLLAILVSLSPSFYVFFVNAVLCLPLISLSTLILLSQVCCKAQMRHRGKLLIVILLSLFFFLTLAFPMNVILLINFTVWNTSFNSYCLILCGLLCTSLNSFVNPLLYFLVGRKKRGLCRENLKLILQRVFIEEEVHREELEASIRALHYHFPLPQN
ncbi:mas-related G-protein coupled receptor member H-like [Tiliqua scincoides]|uniref:mas-related G-protein coupled receptor member H-like n=1 Tax=Tiliqua scincoides TaxID=71010 RepID=UPI0034622626